MKKALLMTIAMLMTATSFAATMERPGKPREEIKGGTAHPSTGTSAKANNRTVLEAIANEQAARSQDQKAGRTMQEIFYDDTRVENDPVAIQGRDRLIARIAELERTEGLTPDQARQKALSEIGKTDKDLVEACGL